MQGIVEEFDENAPLVTTTNPEDVASLVAFLASEAASSISGCLYLVDRGAHMQHYPDVPRHLESAMDT